MRIAELREQRGLTQADLAAKLNVAPRNAQRYEEGVNMKLATLVEIANVLGVSPTDLFVRAQRRRSGPGRPRKRPERGDASPPSVRKRS
jgi:transcriptional regulator with XRE-family HTH domain